MKPDEIEKRLKNALIYGTSHPEAYKTKADELWEKHRASTWDSPEQDFVTMARFLTALTEYGELVKAEAVKVANDERVDADDTKQESDYAYNAAIDHATAAIEKMPLP